MNEWGQYRHRNIIHCSRLPLPFLSEWMLSTGAYLHRDGKGTKERKSIQYLTTKHNPNQKQLEFAGCSINWTASSAWPLCHWLATIMHYNTMVQARMCQMQRYTYSQARKTKTHIRSDKQHTPKRLGIATTLRKTSCEASAVLIPPPQPRRDTPKPL